MPVHSPLPLLSPHALRKTARLTFGVVSLALFSACATDKPDPTGLNARTSAAESNGVPFSVGLASPAWQTRSVALANPSAQSLRVTRSRKSPSPSTWHCSRLKLRLVTWVDARFWRPIVAQSRARRSPC